MVVYIDLLLLDNFCADAALLYCAVRTVRGQAKPLRIALTALAGAVLAVGYTLLGLYVSIPPPLDFFVKYAVAALLPLPAAKFRRKRTYVLCSLAFLGYMAAFAGVLTALFSADMPAVGEAGLIYTFGGLPSGVLAAACVGFGALAVRLVRALAGQARVAAGCLRCVLVLGEKKVSLRAFADTGNRLKDGRGRGVVIAERAVALSLLADGLFSVSTPCEKIEVRTVNGKSFLTAFQIDVLEIYYGGRANILRDVTVAISEQSFAGEYTLILPASFTKEEDFSDSEVKDAEQDPCIPAPVDAQDEDAGKRT